MRIYTLRRDGKYQAYQYGASTKRKYTKSDNLPNSMKVDFTGDTPDFALCELDLFTIQLRQKMYNCEIVCFELVEVPIAEICES